MKLHDLLWSLHSLGAMPQDNPEITSVEMDSRLVKPGSLFICIVGYTVDGHEYVEQAINNGAVAIVSQKEITASVPVIKVRNTTRAMAILANTFYDNPTAKLQMIGITGTNGKTTVSYLIEEVLRQAGRSTGLIGTIGMKINDDLYETKNTTPDSLALQKYFNQMVTANVDVAVMEVSSHALHIGRVHGCQYDVTVFTNLTQDHLDYHKTMDNYRAAKSLLFSQLGNSYDINRPKYAILNIDDSASAEYLVATQAIVLTYGIKTDADLRATDIKTTSSGTEFRLDFDGKTYDVKMGFVGRFNVYNILATIGATLAAGIELEFILKQIPSLQGVPGRFELVDAGQDFNIIVDYAHTPDSLENVLKTIQEFANGKIYCVVGCGGNRDKTKRPIMAKIASELATVPIFTSDNPRNEDPIAILTDMKIGATNKNYQTIVDRRDAIEYAIGCAEAGDVVLIAGKGHETYQIIGDKTLHFDDKEMARLALN